MLDRRRFLATGAAAPLGLAFAARAAMAGDATAATPVPGSPEAQLGALLDRFAHGDLIRSPEEATSLGLDVGSLAGQRSRLEPQSLAAFAEEKADIAARLTALRAIDRRALTGMAAVNYDTVEHVYATQVAADRAFAYGGEGVGEPYILSQLTGSYQSIPDFLDTRHPIANASDAEAYLSRLAAFARVMDEEREVAVHDASLGVIPPDFILDRALAQMNGMAATPAAGSALVTSLVRRTRAKGIDGDWAARATAIYDSEVTPALRRQIALLQGWRPTASHEAGVARLKDGEAYYRASLAYRTTTTLSPAEVHQIGLNEARELSERIDVILRRQGMTQGTVGVRLRALYSDPRLQYPNTDEGKNALIADLNRIVQAMQVRLPTWFGVLPKASVEIHRVPKAIEAGAPGGYYNPPSLDGSRPGIYWINLRDTAEYPKWTLPTLTYHESIPGHHLQGSIEQQTNLPLLRKMTWFSAYGEGWALYAEQLAGEMGVYENDPLGEIGYLQSALFRACRLVVDTGIHYQNWSREKAIAWMAETDGSHESEVVTEVERYCVWPGQACSYKIGGDTWNRLRAKARSALGPAFDIRRFHDAGLLSGAVPLTVLERVIDDYIASAQGRRAA